MFLIVLITLFSSFQLSARQTSPEEPEADFMNATKAIRSPGNRMPAPEDPSHKATTAAIPSNHPKATHQRSYIGYQSSSSQHPHFQREPALSTPDFTPQPAPLRFKKQEPVTQFFHDDQKAFSEFISAIYSGKTKKELQRFKLNTRATINGKVLTIKDYYSWQRFLCCLKQEHESAEKDAAALNEKARLLGLRVPFTVENRRIVGMKRNFVTDEEFFTQAATHTANDFCTLRLVFADKETEESMKAHYPCSNGFMLVEPRHGNLHRTVIQNIVSKEEYKKFIEGKAPLKLPLAFQDEADKANGTFSRIGALNNSCLVKPDHAYTFFIAPEEHGDRPAVICFNEEPLNKAPK